MDTFSFPIRLAATLFVAYEIYTGASWGNFRYSDDSWHAIPQRIYRDETPWFYWISIAMKVGLVLYLWYG